MNKSETDTNTQDQPKSVGKTEKDFERNSSKPIDLTNDKSNGLIEDKAEKDQVLAKINDNPNQDQDTLAEKPTRNYPEQEEVRENVIDDQILAQINSQSPDRNQEANENLKTDSDNEQEPSQNGEERVGQKSYKAPTASTQLMKLFEAELKGIYWAEKALTDAIPKLIQKATSKELIDALTAHLEETHEQVECLASVFFSIDVKPETSECEAIEGLIKEAQNMLETCEAGAMRDAAIIAAVQKIKHYKIAIYGTLRQFAETLALPSAVTLLAATLKEEYSADELLTEIATSMINDEAAELEAKNKEHEKPI